MKEENKVPMEFIWIRKIFAGRNIELLAVSSLRSVLHGVLTVAESYTTS